MSILNKIGSFLGGGLVKDLISGVDKFVTTKEEKANLKIKFTKIVNNFFLQHQQELTERLKIDMASDSWLSKNIRPLTLIFILGAYTAFSVTDGNIRDFTINSSYVTLLGQWGQAIMYFYFGGRTIEKAVSIFKKK